ncbi:outer membrane autotransporter barrel domain-containing protein [Tardiphaga sp. OK246]|jgi:outer membrane autotransporter protein|nr:outer membrane autotransporter barrel domain-containing protein [Tardiphaga sp. OK246]
MRKYLGTTAFSLVVISVSDLLDCCTANAQQVVANGTTQNASGTINTGVLAPTAGYGLYALNNGIIDSFSPLSVITGGSASHAAYAQSGGSITLFSGSSVSTTGGGGVGLFATGINSIVNATDTTVFTTGSNAYGVEAAQGGTVNLAGVSVTTAGSMAYGLFATQANAMISATNVTINTTGGAGYGARANAAGHIALNGGSITTTGSGADALITIDSTATIDAANIIIRTSGPTASGANGFYGSMTLDNLAVTTIGDNSHGARADNAGSVAVTGGTFTTSGASSFGLLATLGSTLTATNATVVTSGASGIGASAQFGGQLILNGGTVTTTGTSAAGLFSVGLLSTLSATPAVPTALILLDDAATPSASPTGSTLTANGVTVRTSGTGSHGASVRGGSSLALNDSTLTVSGAGGAALYSSAYDAGASIAQISNSTLSSAQGAGIRTSGTTLNATFLGSSLAGNPNLLEVVANGTLNLIAASSTLTGAAVTDAGSTSNVTLQNATTWKVTGNSNVSNLSNTSSLIDFAPPSGGAFKTLSAINYTGVGGTIGLNTFLDTDGAPSDRLAINGGTATGDTSLRVTNAGGGGELTVGNGILVVDTTNGGTTAPVAFKLAGPVVAGPFEYTLHRSSVDGSNSQAWYLRSTLDCSLAPNAAVCPSPPGPAPQPPVPNFRPETSLYAAVPAMALLYGRNLLDTFHERAGNREDVGGRTEPNADAPFIGGWGRFIGMTGRRDGDARGIYGTGPQYTYNFLGLQAGQDFVRREHSNGSRDHLGLYFALGGAYGRVTHYDGITGESDVKGYTLGGYWTHFGATGWYFDTVLQGTWYDVTSNANRGLTSLTTDGAGIGGSVEAGYPINLRHGFFIEPQVQIAYQAIDLAGSRDVGAQVRFDKVDSLASRIGARIGRDWSIGDDASRRRLTAWIRPSLWHEFRGNPLTEFSSDTGFTPFQATLNGTWGELNAGVSGRVTSNATLFASVSYQSRFEGKSYAYNGKFGANFSW